MKRRRIRQRPNVTISTARRNRLWLERLECRTLLSGEGTLATYLPAQHNLFDYDGYLTNPSNDPPVKIAEDYLRDHASELGLTSGDLGHYLITTNYTTASTGITTLTFEQSLHGLPVEHSNFNITVMPDGRLLSVVGGFVPGLGARSDQISTTPQMSSRDAVTAAAAELGLVLLAPPTEVTYVTGDLNRDGDVTVTDVAAMMGALSDLTKYRTDRDLTPQQLLQVADVNGDTLVTNADIQALINLVAQSAT